MKFNAQTIVLAIFGIGAIVGVVALATFSGGGPSGRGGISGNVVIWGTLPAQRFTPIAQSVQGAYEDVTIRYVQKPSETFDEELTQALAGGEGPDLFFLPHDRLLLHRNKVFIIPYPNYPRDVFINSFVDQAQLLLDPEGILGIPLMLDPMIMYMNRDIMSSSFLLNPPEYWDELVTLAPQVVQKTDSGSLVQNFVALGTVNNTEHFQDVFSLIMMQSGNSFVGRSNDGELQSTFRFNDIASSVIRFSAVFTNPSQSAYSWNSTQPNDKDAFLRGDLALYFGYASEVQGIRQQNPNLNFSVHMVPQTRDRTTRMTHGRLTALGVSKASQNLTAAFMVAQELSTAPYGQALQESFFVPPVQRSLLAQAPDDPTMRIFYNSAIISRGWLNPNPNRFRQLFNTMMQDINSGRLRVGEAVNRIDAQLEEML